MQVKTAGGSFKNVCGQTVRGHDVLKVFGPFMGRF